MSARWQSLLPWTAAVLVLSIGGLWLLHRQGYRVRWPVHEEAEALARGGRPSGSPSSARKSRWSVVLISIDTLRADHLGCYGYPRPTSPRIDALAAEGVLFEEAIAQAPSTLPSHASLLTSLLPSQHQASVAASRPVPGTALSLAEVLSASGLPSAAFHGGGQLAPELGLEQGFTVYRQIDGPFEATVDAGLAWVDQQAGPFFLFLHTYQVHHPYMPPVELLRMFDPDYRGPLPDRITKGHLARINRLEEPALVVNEADRAHIVAAYDAEIRAVDGAVGRLLEELGRRGILERSVVVFTSDHGEELGEHGSMGWHSHTLYEELLHVPLILRLGSKWAGRRISDQVRSLDVAPTVTDFLGLGVPGAFQGRSLLGLLEGEAGEALLAPSQRDSGLNPPVSSLRTPRWKLYVEVVRWPLYRLRLYDLERDPGETENLVARHPEVARDLMSRLRNLERAPSQEQVELSPETRRQLEALGYID